MKTNDGIQNVSEDEIAEIMHLYLEEPTDSPYLLWLKKKHNKLANDTLNCMESAKKDADRINQIFSPNFNRIKWMKRISCILTIIFGFYTLLIGVLISSQDGYVIITPEFVGLSIAGLGLATSGLFSLISYEDDTYQLLFISRSDQQQIFSEINILKVHLSSITIDIEEIKHLLLKRNGSN